jgi:glycine hydroxymethyltransferase
MITPMAYLQRYLYKIPPENRNSGAMAFYAALDHIAETAPSVTAAILAELRVQSSRLKMIASENYCSLAVQLAMGNLLTDKYAEGFPYHRFYAGCENVDTVETEACEELKLLFSAQHAYVQPHSGADANLVAYWAILAQKVEHPYLEKLSRKHLDELSAVEYEKLRQITTSQTLLAMSLASGGHLTHGYRQNLTGKMFRVATYDVDPQTQMLNYDQIAAKAREVKPLILVAGYSAYTRKINYARLREIADEVGAVLMVDMAHFAGLVAGKVYEGEYDPVYYADVVTSTSHKTLRGPRGGFVLCKSPYKEMINKGCPLVLGGPLPQMMAAKTICFKEAQAPQFREYADRVVRNAQALAETLLKHGLTIATGGTENHMVLVDVRDFKLTGRQAETVLHACGITLNRNALFNDSNGPWYTSGVRIGTPALTTLGMGPQEMQLIGEMIISVLKNTKSETAPDGKPSRSHAVTDPKVREKTQAQVKELLLSFPLYPELDMEGVRTKGAQYVPAD